VVGGWEKSESKNYIPAMLGCIRWDVVKKAATFSFFLKQRLFVTEEFLLQTPKYGIFRTFSCKN
jgi:hypothetical protein